MLNRHNHRRQFHRIPLQIALIYAAIGAAWILLSDRALLAMVQDPLTISRLQTYKGWFYVLFTAAILYLLIHRQTLALQAQFNEIRMIFDSLNAIVYVADFETHELLHLNRRGEMLAGTSAWRGKTCFELLQRGQREPCDFCTNDRLVIDGEVQPPYTWEFKNTRDQRWYQCIDKAIRWPDGRLARLEIALDITETKDFEQLKGEMLAAVGHEMRTPLTAILGFAEYLLDHEPTTEERHDYLTILLNEARRLNRVIDNFLRLNRLKARRESYRMQPVSPRELLLATAGKFVQTSPKHRLRVADGRNTQAFWGDLDAMSLVMDNLVANAIKYSPDGGDITLGTHDDTGEAILWVKDSGIGMEGSELQRIFNDFYRIDNTDRRRTSGAGLGLTLVREIVRLHRGRVWAESVPGAGSTFYLALPAMPATPAVTPASRGLVD